MTTESPTARKILESGRQLFNAKGYAATSLRDIAEAVGISKGNLTYHFPTKRSLAMRIIEETRTMSRSRRRNLQPGNIADDYVEHLLFAMNTAWENRFVLRDREEFAAELDRPNSELAADYRELLELIKRIQAQGMFRRDAVDDIHVLTRSIWIVSRYWMDYLREFEGHQEITWDDQELGIRQHFAVLLPCLTATAKKAFNSALERAPTRITWQSSQLEIAGKSVLANPGKG